MTETQEIKERFIELIREELKKIKLPKEIRIDSGSLITDPAKFLDSHLNIVKANEGYMKQVYGTRLSSVLIGVGVDIHSLKRKAEKEIKAKKNENEKKS